ncbi:MAG TPA: ATP-grasp fold amidoligase family protein [Candidatus Saccharimonadales bacterium]|nr:ATP-grasp fold amidoligase family protein [Candidatus Saccharimonadales bacterium]
MIKKIGKWTLHKLLLSLPAKPYLYIFYYLHTKQRLTLKDPNYFTHKLQWLKLYGRLERFALYGDKFSVRAYVSSKLGEKHMVPLIGVWDRVEDIPFDTLPSRFVLKLTTGSGYNFICKDKKTADLAAGKQLLRKGLRENFYREEREPQYKQHIPRIIAEAYMEDETGQLRDFKIHCEKGEPRIIQVDTDRFTNHRSDQFDVDWNEIDYMVPAMFGGEEPAQNVTPIPRPKELPQLLDAARKLSEGFPYVRVDLYLVRGKVYFGEMTFTPGSGIVALEERAELEMGKLVDLHAY